MKNKVLNKYILNDEYAELIIQSDKYGELIIKIDLEDVDKCKEYNWSINKHKVSKQSYGFYAVNSKVGQIHRYIMNTTNKYKVIDHKNGKTLDCRKNNLRECTRQENSMNRKIKYTNNSGITGVLWYHYNNVNKWMAYIKINYKHITLGYFEKFEDAVKVRKEAEIKYFGEYVR
ncbi:HNH endonuclease [Clostridium sp. ZBS18]|uniref:HNH endonuclease n=1 Tax=Clostridium sp. ZBS18 TaxID=2949967 RepID=UPI00207A3537|nr:HNH endonuclease [Clostridium sp. ZBS18]